MKEKGGGGNMKSTETLVLRTLVQTWCLKVILYFLFVFLLQWLKALHKGGGSPGYRRPRDLEEEVLEGLRGLPRHSDPRFVSPTREDHGETWTSTPTSHETRDPVSIFHVGTLSVIGWKSFTVVWRSPFSSQTLWTFGRVESSKWFHCLWELRPDFMVCQGRDRTW